MTVALSHAARCLSCDWTANGDTTDRQAEKHTKATGHGTVTSMTSPEATR
ncbi:MAG: hypothetical protein ACRDQA_06725 [Nocardioidaceae bacterium]